MITSADGILQTKYLLKSKIVTKITRLIASQFQSGFLVEQVTQQRLQNQSSAQTESPMHHNECPASSPITLYTFFRTP